MSSELLTTEHYPEWDLSALYTHDADPEIERDWAYLETHAKTFQKKYSQMFTKNGWCADDLCLAIETYEALSERMGKLSTYASLRYYKNAQDVSIVQAFQSTQERLAQLSSYFVFFSLDLNTIDDSALESAFDHSHALQKYRPYIKNLRLMKPYQKSEDVEKVLIDKSLTSHAAFVRLFDETMADMSFVIDGETHQLSFVTEMMSNPDASVRRKAAVALSKGLASKEKLFTFITNTLAKDKDIEDRLRGFETPMHARHLDNQTEPEVVDALVNTVRSHYEKLSHRYYAIKAKILNVDHLNYWDRNAPLSSNLEKKYTWLEAKKLVLDAYRAFSPQLADIGQTFFDNNWIDVPSTPGKTDGAFSHPAVPCAHPFILLNFHGSKRDVMTLAHELGHGIHQVLAAKQGYLLCDTPLTLAETASVFGEMLTFQSLIRACENDAERQILLASKIDDMINTVVRQIAFYNFEVAVHAKRKEGELAAQELHDLWLSTQAEALGPQVHLDPLVGNYWGYISHFIHSPFYVYAYAFGDCLVNSLFAVYQKHPDGFVEKYIDMLQAGGSRGYKDMLSPFGLDATHPQFWEQGLSMIESLIDELESLS